MGWASAQRTRLGRGTARLLLGVLVLRCGSGTTPAISPSPSLTDAIAIPTGELPPEIQCLIDNGSVILRIDPPQFEGDQPGYVLQGPDLPMDEQKAISEECHKLAPPYHWKTEAEVRVIYDRWVGEYECLIGLGYHPTPPPSFEKFLADWKTGPWDPTFGVDTNAWTAADYAEAKQKCVLEFFTRD